MWVPKDCPKFEIWFWILGSNVRKVHLSTIECWIIVQHKSLGIGNVYGPIGFTILIIIVNQGTLGEWDRRASSKRSGHGVTYSNKAKRYLIDMHSKICCVSFYFSLYVITLRIFIDLHRYALAIPINFTRLRNRLSTLLRTWLGSPPNSRVFTRQPPHTKQGMFKGHTPRRRAKSQETTGSAGWGRRSYLPETIIYPRHCIPECAQSC
jgi:hypothetical protein